MRRATHLRLTPTPASSALATSVLLAVALLLPGCGTRSDSTNATAHATSMRTFPATALRGVLEVQSLQEARLNGTPVRLAPGVVVRGDNNMLQPPTAFSGKPMVVNYTLDISGHVGQVWVLTPAEQARSPWPRTPAEAAAWQFDALLQTWTRR